MYLGKEFNVKIRVLTRVFKTLTFFMLFADDADESGTEVCGFIK